MQVQRSAEKNQSGESRPEIEKEMETVSFPRQNERLGKEVSIFCIIQEGKING